MTTPEWNITNIPSEGHKDLGQFIHDLFYQALQEKQRLGLPDRWDYNHRHYRSGVWTGKAQSKMGKHRVSASLFFSNVQRTVANITAREPVAEVIDLEGLGGDKEYNVRLPKWWQDTKQQAKLKTTALRNEKYGVTIEKSIWDDEKKHPDNVIVDPHAYFPAPGYWEEPAADMPYAAHAMPEDCDVLKKMFNTEEDVKPDDVYSVLGESREANRTMVSGSASSLASGGYSDKMYDSTQNKQHLRESRALVIEMWVRD